MQQWRNPHLPAKGAFELRGEGQSVSKRRISGCSPKHPFALLVMMRCLRDGCRLHHVRQIAAESFSFGGRSAGLCLSGGDHFFLLLCRAVSFASGRSSLLPLGLLLLCLLCRLMLRSNLGLCRTFVPGKTISAWARGSMNGGEVKILVAAVCKG